MIHGPCGLAKIKAPCMIDGICSKHFPKQYEDVTRFDKDGYVHYVRRNDGRFAVKNKIKLDNSYVVPYNKNLSLVFQAHFNVEYCGWSMMIKYLFKYISKGADRIRATITKSVNECRDKAVGKTKEINEIKNFVDARFICPNEAAWRIFDFDIHNRNPAVQVLAVHLEKMQVVSFKDKQLLQNIIDNPMTKKTTLTQWLYNNQIDARDRHLTYLNYLSEYKWVTDGKDWDRRTSKKTPAIGRLVYIHPTCGEVIYLRMLLGHQTGCQTFADIRTIGRIVFPTYRSACEKLGLLDREWSYAFEEASISASAREMRSLFAHMLLFCEISDPVSLCTQQWRRMSDDIEKNAAAYTHIMNLHVNDEDLQSYILYYYMRLKNRLLMEETSYDRVALTEQHKALVSQLNKEQQLIYDYVLEASLQNKQELIFVYGHGGTGKTFLWTTIISALRAIGKIVLAVASSGIASLLLPAGRTAHSRFKIPLDITNQSICHIKKNTQLSRLLSETVLIIWDEAPMNDRRCFEALDKTLKDILDQLNNPFGGKSVLLGGDFRQTLLIKPGGTKMDIIESSIVRSTLWKHFKMCKLFQIMRLLKPNITLIEKDEITNFSSWLLKIGNGCIGISDKDDPIDTKWVDIPQVFLIPDHKQSLTDLINFIYTHDVLKYPTPNMFCDKAIICPKNETADEINKLILDILPGN